MLSIDPTSPTRGPARLRDFVWGGAAWDHALHQRADGARWLVRSRVEGDRRVLCHYLRRADGLQALDETVFRLAPDFAETERRYTRGQANQHPTPIALPAAMHTGDTVSPLPGVTVTLGWHGYVVLTVGPRHAHVPAIALTAATQGTLRVQWLVHGVGEVAVGLGEGRWERWLEAWSGGDRHLLGGTPSEAGLPELPETAPVRPTGVY